MIMVDLLEFGGQSFLSLLPEVMAERLVSAGVAVRFEDGETVHLRGDIRPGLSIVKSGAVRFSIPGIDGSSVTSSILGGGHSFGEATLFAKLPRTHDAIAVGATTINQISKARFDKIFDEEPGLARIMLEATTTRLYSVLEFMDDLRRHPLNVRVAKIIFSMAQSSKVENVIEISQSDFAFTLGVSRVSIGKALAGLQSDGLIKLGYGKISIANYDQLNNWITDHSVLAPLARN
ncbi:Crp/Fnr family transcriptional regulator [Hyphococcus lacteus]|uniref:Crp/Fnr family transcriptional regulator n=1 Tax=Hyphococcus lacteus TaxID=3143536 RepID=A0ABV3Z5N2_9PROT